MTFAEKVVRAVDADRGAMAALLSALVAIPKIYALTAARMLGGTQDA